ncbi:hypothetical protein N780_10090 [Pontibacillus chungwhensis BH030062]|uniref:Uncharacterized protein n=1 Tax=Pontibacillus chungwhensis BH030062 TaxID=1385513 RepID=A0A0A2V7X3_9BACI|nr:hypothetical protein N780_10090 [Pontibacillus chungwhensis BH030062]
MKAILGLYELTFDVAHLNVRVRFAVLRVKDSSERQLALIWVVPRVFKTSRPRVWGEGFIFYT